MGLGGRLGSGGTGGGGGADVLEAEVTEVATTEGAVGRSETIRRRFHTSARCGTWHSGVPKTE